MTSMTSKSRPGATWVNVEDWDTIWPLGQRKHQSMRPGVDYFRASSGYVRPGPVTELRTDFTTLTEAQHKVLAQENAYYLERELKMKGHVTVTIIAPGVYTREDDASTWPNSMVGHGAG